MNSCNNLVVWSSFFLCVCLSVLTLVPPYKSCSCLFSFWSAGLIVKQMGLPLKLVAMVNSNDIVHRMVTSGDFSMAANVTQTLAPAIDIQVETLHLLLCAECIYFLQSSDSLMA